MRLAFRSLLESLFYALAFFALGHQMGLHLWPALISAFTSISQPSAPVNIVIPDFWNYSAPLNLSRILGHQNTLASRVENLMKRLSLSCPIACLIHGKDSQLVKEARNTWGTACQSFQDFQDEKAILSAMSGTRVETEGHPWTLILPATILPLISNIQKLCIQVGGQESLYYPGSAGSIILSSGSVSAVASGVSACQSEAKILGCLSKLGIGRAEQNVSVDARMVNWGVIDWSKRHEVPLQEVTIDDEALSIAEMKKTDFDMISYLVNDLHPFMRPFTFAPK